MKEPSSLKSRLIAAATAWIAFGLLMAWLLLSNVFQSHVTKQFYDELFVHLEELQRLAVLDDDHAKLRASLSDPRYEVENSGFYWEIQRGGTVLARSASMKAAPLKTPPDGRGDVGVHTHTIAGPTGALLVAERLEWADPSKHPLQFIIGTDKRHLDGVVRSFNATLSWSLAALGISMACAAALLILYAMRPLSQLNQALLDVRSGRSKTLAGTFPAEVQPLVDNLNSLIGSTRELVQRARTQAGNIAHGLKTSLAVLTDEAYRIGESGLPDHSATIIDQCRKMQSHIDYQTTRARVVANRLSPGASADVGEAAADVVSALSRLYEHNGIRFENDIGKDLRVACDRQDLQEVLANIIDNAGKHARSLVRVSAAAASPDLVTITIMDDGPGLPVEAHEVVFNIGERWDTQSAGTGLGLAIARDLVTLYAGSIELGPSAAGGLSVVIKLPATN